MEDRSSWIKERKGTALSKDAQFLANGSSPNKYDVTDWD